MPSLEDLRSKLIVSGTPDTDDLVPYFDVSEFGNGPVKKTTVGNLVPSTSDASTNPEVVLKSNVSGNIILNGLTVFQSLDVGGESVSDGVVAISQQSGNVGRVNNAREANGTNVSIPSLGVVDAVMGATIVKTTTGDPGVGDSGVLCINTFDNTLKVYAEGAWRQIITW